MVMARHRWRGPAEPDRGAAAVEFALVSLLLFLLLFGIIEFGAYFAQNLALSNGARQGARYGVVPNTSPSSGLSANPTCAAITSAAQGASGTIAVNPSQVQVQVVVIDPAVGSPSTLCTYSTGASSSTVPCAGTSPGTTLTVTTKAVVPVLVPLIFSGSTLTVKGQGVFRCEFGAS